MILILEKKLKHEISIYYCYFGVFFCKRSTKCFVVLPVRHIEHAIGCIVVEIVAIAANSAVASQIAVRASFAQTWPYSLGLVLHWPVADFVTAKLLATTFLFSSFLRHFRSSNYKLFEATYNLVNIFHSQ